MDVSTAQIGAVQRADIGMALTKGDPLNGGDGGDPVADLLAAQLADPALNKAVTWQAVELADVAGVFQFRSKVGYRKVVLTIPVPVDYQDDKLIAHQEKVYKRRYPGTEGAKELKRLVRLAERHGGRQVVFKDVPGKFECHFETDDRDLAAFVRASDEFKNGRIFEVLLPMTVTLPGGETISVVPADDAARQALATARAA